MVEGRLSVALLRKDSRAFTLLEVIAVILIMSMMAGIVTPALARGLRKNSLSAQAGRLAALVRYARGRAVFARVGCELRIDQAAGEYVLARPGGESGAEDALEGKWTLPSGVHFEEVSISPLPEIGWDQSPQEDKSVIKFRPLGTTDGGKIVLADQKRRRIVVSIEPVTGAVEVVRDEG